MTEFNISQAAKVVKKDRKTIQRYLQKGKLSCRVDAQGQKLIEVSELERVFGKIPHPSSVSQPGLMSQKGSSYTTEHETSLLKEKIALLESKISFLESHIEDLKEQRKQWQEQANKLLLTQKNSWWNRLKK